MIELLIGVLVLASIACALRECDCRGDDEMLLDPERFHHVEVSVYEPVAYIEDEYTKKHTPKPAVLSGVRPVHLPHPSRNAADMVVPLES